MQSAWPAVVDKIGVGPAERQRRGAGARVTGVTAPSSSAGIAAVVRRDVRRDRDDRFGARERHQRIDARTAQSVEMSDGRIHQA